MSNGSLTHLDDLIQLLSSRNVEEKLGAYIGLLYLYHTDFSSYPKIDFIQLFPASTTTYYVNHRVNIQLMGIYMDYKLNIILGYDIKPDINAVIEQEINKVSDLLKDIHYNFIRRRITRNDERIISQLSNYVDPTFGTVFELYYQPLTFYNPNYGYVDFTKIFPFMSLAQLIKYIISKGIGIPLERESRILMFPVVSKFSTASATFGIITASFSISSPQTVYGYKILEKIGEGATSTVYKAEKRGNVYAIKIFKPVTSGGTTMMAKSYFDNITAEAGNLIMLSEGSPYVIKIEGIHVDRSSVRDLISGRLDPNNPPAIIMEFMEGGSVETLMLNPNITYSTYWPGIVKKIIRQVAMALAYLHSKGYVHLDVKPQNIFLSKNPGKTGGEVYTNIDGIVKLGDLGSAVKVGGKIDQVTPSYAPPEQVEAVILGKGADPKMDIFALGMTAYVMLTLRRDNPAGDYLDKAIEAINQGKVGEALNFLNQAKQTLAVWKPVLPQNTPLDLQQAIFRALNPDPKLRPTAQEIVNTLRYP
ncbi:hypothetical protein SJAV_27030 [Sulfurisphaera javensis]|uniref:non-specific serine/threonine protein kinase n=1 Tax=Sulfurisphaera javensis TaxID=2049879 RepID=A0AAT9GV47_9CREN